MGSIQAKMEQATCAALERRSRQRVKCGCLECACTTLGAVGWVVWVPGEWEELREEGLALDGREARSLGVKGHPLDSE